MHRNTSADRSSTPPPTGRYTQLPDALLSLLTPRGHMLVHALLSYKWYADSAIYPSVPTLAKQLGWSVRTVQRTMRRLESDGYIVVRACYRSDDGQASNLYESGPALLPYLPPSPARPDTTPVTPRHPVPVTHPSGERSGRRTIPTRMTGSQSGQKRPRGFIPPESYTAGSLGAYIRT